jgi:rubredoxin---NAD+ reductase
MTTPVVIVGTGIAGYTVARELRKLDRTVPIVLISEGDGAFYSKPMLSNALALKKHPDQLASFDAAAMAQQLDARIATHARVERIAPDAKEIVVDGRAMAYSRLVLAVGADARRVPLSGDGADDVLSINSLDDYRRFRERLDGARSIAILGAGLIGCEFANDLALGGLTVSLIDPASTPLSRLLPERAANLLGDALKRQGVHLHLGRTLAAVEKAERGYRLAFSNGDAFAADLVISAIGLAPRTQLAAEAGIRIDGGIHTDAYCHTNIDDIFAIGDCAAFEGKVQPYILPIMHAARALAQTLAGTPTRVAYPVMPITIKTPAAPTVIVPPFENGEWQFEAADDAALPTLRAICERSGDKRTIGFALLGQATAEKNALIKAMSTLSE